MTVFPDSEGLKSPVVFEDAMTAAGFGKFNILSMLLCTLMLLGMIMETIGFSYVIPACQCDLELTLTMKGWIAAIPFIGIILTSYVWGYLADTKGRKKILLICMSVGSVLSIISSMAPNLLSFVILRFVASLFIAGPASLIYTYLGELSPKKQRDMMITLGNTAVSTGTAAVPALAWAILPLDFNFEVPFLIHGFRPWRLLISMFALPYLVSSFLLFLLPESPKYLMSRGNTEKALRILKRIYSINTGKEETEYPFKYLTIDEKDKAVEYDNVWKKIWEQTAPLLRKGFVGYSLILCFLQFSNFITTNGFYIWFPAIVDRILRNNSTGLNLCDSYNYYPQSHQIDIQKPIQFDELTCDDTLNPSTFPISISLALAVSLISCFTAFTINKIGKRNILMGLFFTVGIASFLIHFMRDPIWSLLMFSMIQVCGTNIGLINAYVVEIYPTQVRAMAVSLSMMMGRFGSMAGVNIIGYLIEYHCTVNFFLFSVILIVSALVCFLLPRDKKPKSQNNIIKTRL